MELDRAGCTVTGTAADVVGHTTSSRLSPNVALIDLRTGSERASYRGSWHTLRHSAALNDSLTRSAEGGSRVDVAFEGAQVAVVARRGPSGGRFEVSIDGRAGRERRPLRTVGERAPHRRSSPAWRGATTC